MNSPQTALVPITQALMSEQFQGQLLSMLPKEVPVDRFTNVVITALSRTPELLEADRQSLYNSCVALATRGLLPDGKQAALVVFNTNVAARGQQAKWVKKVQDMAMVEGIIAEMGKVGIPAYAVSVYKNDKVRLWNDDDGQHVEHEPMTFGDRGERIGAFAAGKMPNGRTYVEAMNMADLEKVAARSKQAKRDNNGKYVERGGTWASDGERMEQKSCLHRLRRRVPLTVPLPDDSESEMYLDGETTAPVQTEPGATRPSDAAHPVDGVRAGEQASPAGSTQGADNARGARRRPRALQSVIDQTAKPASAAEPKKEPEPVIEAEAESDEPREGDII